MLLPFAFALTAMTLATTAMMLILAAAR